jgi:hypothetical protein
MHSRAAWGGLLLAASLAACGFDWDLYDPRLGSGATGGAGLAGGGGSGLAGGGGSGLAGGGGSGLTGGGGTGGGGTGGAGLCGSVDVLGDNFDDNVLPTDWDANGWGLTDLQEAGSEIQITLPADGSGGEAYLTSWRYYDLRDRRLRIEIPTMVDGASDAEAWFGIEYDADNDADIIQDMGQLYFEVGVDGNHVAIETIPYDSTAHRWLAFREQAGVLYLETSPDGIAWTTQASRDLAFLFPMDSLSVSFGGYDPGSATVPWPSTTCRAEARRSRAGARRARSPITSTTRP